MFLLLYLCNCVIILLNYYTVFVDMHQSPKTCYMALGLVPSVSLLKMGFSLGAPGALWAVHTGAKYTPTHSARWHQPGPVYAFRQHKGWQWLTHKKTHLY